MKNYKNSAGFSVVELMIALTLGLVLVLGVLQVFLGNRQGQRMEQSVSRIEESGRIALDLMVQDMRLAGYYGCAKPLLNEITSDSAGGVRQTFSNHIVGSSSWMASNFVNSAVRGYTRNTTHVWSPNTIGTDFISSMSSALANARDGSDVISIYFGHPIKAVLAAQATQSSTSLSVTRNGHSFSNGEQIILVNCSTADLIKITNVPDNSAAATSLSFGSPDNNPTALSSAYGVNTEIVELLQRVYYVADSGRTAPNGDHIFSLFMLDGFNSPQELVEGVEFMRILYGEDVNRSGSIRYVSAGTAGLANENIVSLKIGLLAQSFDSVRDADDAATYTVLDQRIGPPSGATTIKHSGGRSLRRVYTLAVELRNRMEK